MNREGSQSWKRLNHLFGEIEAAYHEASLCLGITGFSIPGTRQMYRNIWN